MTPLYDRIYGALIGSAIGDAMGGPVEGLRYDEIARRHGRVETLLPYTEVKPSYHGPFGVAPGSYTDDTRISILLGRAAVHAGGLPKKGDITHEIASYYFGARTELERGFIEEYYQKAVYGDDKEAFGGRPTNGGIMGIASLGALFPAAPGEAFSHVFRTLFLSTGTARTASAYAAAMIGAAMRLDADWESVLRDAGQGCTEYKREVEASGWRNSDLYPVVATKTEGLVGRAVDLGREAATVDELRENLYNAVVQPFFADGSETLSLAVAMFAAARGDFRETVIGCVNFGRDNDSSAAVGGAVAGALCGAACIPGEWVELVETANPAPTLASLAEELTAVTARRYGRLHRVARDQQPILGNSTDGTTEDPDETDESGKTSLHRAAAAGDDATLAELLLRGADVNARDSNMTTALHFAAWENHISTVRILLRHGADADLAEGSGWTALHDALRREYVDIVFEILESSRLVSEPETARAAADALDGDARFKAILTLLAGSEVRIDSVGICGQSLLHDAVERGYRDSSRFLAKHGADVNQLALSLWDTRYEGTPLHKAAAFGQKEIYADLLAAGADESIRNIDGKTPPELVREHPA